MNWGSPEFVIAIVAISIGGWILNNWMRMKHGYPIEDENGELTVHPNRPDDGLRQENKQLRKELKNVSERMIVLEKIVTDRGYSLADEIEALRDKPGTDAGVPLNLEQKEKA